MRETMRKCARTFSNMPSLAEEYPELIFACSSAQQYAWIKQSRPELFERIGKAVGEGTFVPVGGMWVEADGNMPGGEALARQLVYGRRFFAEEFGIEQDGVWLPDSFGYTAAYPQLARLAGAEWFLSQKLHWSETNELPHHTFAWEGIDGTRILTHFPPIDSYNAELTGRELAHAQSNFARQGRRHRCRWPPSATATAAAVPPARCWRRPAGSRDLEGSPRVEVQNPVAVLPGGSRANTRTPRYGAASCTWNTTAAHTPARPAPSAATGARRRCCARPSCGRRRPRRAPERHIRTRNWTTCGSRCCCISSTTSCPAPRSPGCTARPRRSTDGSTSGWKR